MKQIISKNTQTKMAQSHKFTMIHSLFVWTCIVLAQSMAHQTTANECTWQTYGQSIMCYMRTIDNTSTIDFSDVDGVATTTSLTIHCDGSVFDESVIADGFFRRLENLEEIIISGCKLLHLINGTFAGLRNLRRVEVETYNNAWGTVNQLELATGLFEHHTNVNDLKLTQNNMRAVPNEILCPIKGLAALNVSFNRIATLDDFAAVAHICGASNHHVFAELEVLDVSNNQLSSVDSDWIDSNLGQLKVLRLQHNNLTKIAGDAFHGMHALTHLNVSYNQLESLPNGMLNETRKLQELHLQNNKLYQLPSGLFHDLSELMVLDLSSNQLSNSYIDSWTFSGPTDADAIETMNGGGLKRLVVLNLANNALTRIDAQTFQSLMFLQVLDMRNNSIGFVDERAFMPLTNLHTLNLSGNRLHIISAGLFNGMYVLSRLVLSNNLITLIDRHAFRNCSSLKDLDLSSNQLTEVPPAVRDLSMLKNLDLGENRITTMYNDSFESMAQLSGLRLMDNLITNITNGIFYPLSSLKVLNLAKNKIQHIELHAFTKNTEIEAIRLDKNQIPNIDGIFAALNSLLWLNLSENQLAWFDFAFIPMNLKWLDIHSNFIEELGNYYRLQPEITITTLDASHNRITELGPMSVPNSIELFFVNNNLIRNVYPNTFIDKQNLTRVDLYSNAISKLPSHALRVSAMAVMKKNTEFYLSGNPFECDCTMGWLKNVNEIGGGQLQHQHPRVMDYDNIECLVSHTRSTPVRLLSSLSTDEFLCRYESKCPTTCHCCENTKCYCNIKCPDGCSCFHDSSFNINKINCGKQNAQTIPERVPMDATDLYLDGNNLFELQANTFTKLRHLRTLYVNNSNVIAIQPQAFHGLSSNLQRLHLEDNKLTTLYGNEFSSLYHLKELYLQNNLITYIENTTFHSMKYLQVLRLDGNRLTALTGYQMRSAHLRNLKSLTLSRNLWTCNCAFVQEFISFIYDSNVIVSDSSAIYCVEDNSVAVIDTINGNQDDLMQKGRRLLIDRGLINDCKNVFSGQANNVLVMPPEGIPHGYIPLLSFILVIIFILGVLVAIFTIKEQMCCIYSTSSDPLSKSNGRTIGTAKSIYDVLVLAAKDDCDYVMMNVVADLKQSKSQMRIGMQHKNVAAAKLLTAAYSSRKLVIYVTNNFLQTEWSRPEIRSAVANSWMPGKVILVQAPNLNLQTNADRELFNNAGRGVVLLRTWEIDFTFKLAYAIETHPSHYAPSAQTTLTTSAQQPLSLQHGLMGVHEMHAPLQQYQQHQAPSLVSYYGAAPIGTWKSTIAPNQILIPYQMHMNEPQSLTAPDGSIIDKNDSYYSTATASSILSKQTVEHVYIGIDSDYGSATNDEPSAVQRGLATATTITTPTIPK